MREYELVVGLEIHAELNTKTKIFCACKNEFGAEPNTNCCPVCMGFPGVLPVLNRTVVDSCMRMGAALGCRINRLCKSDRKNYFYPDLPKAYQISQFDLPVCEAGAVDYYSEGALYNCRITRIHIEEDAGKLTHESALGGSLVDYNRCGVPLIEIRHRARPSFESAGQRLSGNNPPHPALPGHFRLQNAGGFYPLRYQRFRTRKGERYVRHARGDEKRQLFLRR